MKHTFRFLSKVLEIILIACVVFVIPAIVHTVFTFTNHYISDISNTLYCGVMSFISFLVTVFYVVIEAERIESKQSKF